MDTPEIPSLLAHQFAQAFKRSTTERSWGVGIPPPICDCRPPALQRDVGRRQLAIQRVSLAGVNARISICSEPVERPRSPSQESPLKQRTQVVWIHLNTMALISGRRASNSGNQLEICYVSGPRARLLRVSALRTRMSLTVVHSNLDHLSPLIRPRRRLSKRLEGHRVGPRRLRLLGIGDSLD